MLFLIFKHRIPIDVLLPRPLLTAIIVVSSLLPLRLLCCSTYAGDWSIRALGYLCIAFFIVFQTDATWVCCACKACLFFGIKSRTSIAYLARFIIIRAVNNKVVLNGENEKQVWDELELNNKRTMISNTCSIDCCITHHELQFVSAHLRQSPGFTSS